MAALEAAMAQGKQVFLCTQRRADCEDPREPDLYRVGVMGDVVQMLKLPDNTIKVLIEGSSRAVIERFLETEPHLRVEVALLDEDIQPSSELEASVGRTTDSLSRPCSRVATATFVPPTSTPISCPLNTVAQCTLPRTQA